MFLRDPTNPLIYRPWHKGKPKRMDFPLCFLRSSVKVGNPIGRRLTIYSGTHDKRLYACSDPFVVLVPENRAIKKLRKSKNRSTFIIMMRRAVFYAAQYIFFIPHSQRYYLKVLDTKHLQMGNFYFLGNMWVKGFFIEEVIAIFASPCLAQSKNSFLQKLL